MIEKPERAGTGNPNVDRPSSGVLSDERLPRASSGSPDPFDKDVARNLPRENPRAVAPPVASFGGGAEAGAIVARDVDPTKESLFDPAVAADLQKRWNEIQVAFVDEPRGAVKRADELVVETTKRLADSFAAGRQRLEGQWDRGGDVSTEHLRLALQRYRAFFHRLLAM